MALTRIVINGFKSIEHCDISLSEINVFLGENGSGKTNLLEAISYFYSNLTETILSNDVFDENNRFNNEIRIALIYDLSDFVKISKSNADEATDFPDDTPTSKAKYASYYKTIISMASKSASNLIRVELSQTKGHPIHWNCSYEDRFTLKSLFPIFFINTRDLDISEWKKVWDALGELSKVSNTERKAIETSISEILLDESKEIARKLHDISKIFQVSNVNIKPAASKDFAKNLSKIFFSGETIQQNGKRLAYYSTGTNSVKYVELLLRTIDEISRLKLKEPIVLFDEPEISLHSKFVDELAAAMLETSSKLCLMISTHSARLIKNLIIQSNDLKLFNVTLLNKHSRIQGMKKFPQYSPVSKYRVTDDHINSYFSRAILFVEGESELELFSNPYLQKLFPVLANVDVFKAMTDSPILKIMTPKLLQTHTPYLCLIDMDKALQYNSKKKTFTLKPEYQNKESREYLKYRNKHEVDPYLFHHHHRINAMAEKLRVHYYLPFMGCDDLYYREFITTLKDYLLKYNVFAFETTVEGALINHRTQSFSLTFLSTRTKETDFRGFHAYFDTLRKTDRINCLRMVFKGKSDLLQSWSNVCGNLSPNDKATIEKVSIGNKTSWISDFLDTFFYTNTGGAKSLKEFQRYIQDEKKRKHLIEEFKYSFPELFSILEIFSKMF